MTDLKTFISDETILGETSLYQQLISPGWLESLQLLFTEDKQATQYYECYLKNIERADIAMPALVLLYQSYLFSLYKEQHKYQIVSPVVYIIYDNHQRRLEPESCATEAWDDLLVVSFNSPFFQNLGVTSVGNKLIFKKDDSFYFLRVRSTEDTLGLNVAGGLLFLEDMLDTRGRLDRCEFSVLHQGLLRRIECRFMSQRKRYPGTLLIGTPSNFGAKVGEYYEQRIKDLELNNIESYTSKLLEEKRNTASYPLEIPIGNTRCILRD